MTQRIVKISTAELSRQISDFTIGLAKLTVHDRAEDATCAGSATLASVGKIDGLLTAAHVLDALPKTGDVGIILFQNRTMQKQVIKIEDAELPIIIRAEEFGCNGPDLGFLRLPQTNVSWLKATNSFYNLKKRRDKVLGNESPVPNYVEAVVGMIDVFTKDVLVDDPTRRAKVFSAIFCSGEVRTNRNESGFDLLDVAITPYPDFPLPDNFQGMSGGALWRFYFFEKDNIPSIVEKRLVGVPFHQSAAEDGTKIITCHGPVGIHSALIDAITTQWPEDAKRG